MGGRRPRTSHNINLQDRALVEKDLFLEFCSLHLHVSEAPYKSLHLAVPHRHRYRKTNDIIGTLRVEQILEIFIPLVQCRSLIRQTRGRPLSGLWNSGGDACLRLRAPPEGVSSSITPYCESLLVSFRGSLRPHGRRPRKSNKGASLLKRHDYRFTFGPPFTTSKFRSYLLWREE